MIKDAEIVLVAYGSVARAAYAAADAARKEGFKVGVFKPVTIWPFPEGNLNRIKQTAKSFLVCEMNHGQIYWKVKEVVEGAARVDFLGQYDGKLIKPEKILSAIKGVKGDACY